MKTTPRASFAQHPLAQIAVAYSAGVLTSYYLHIALLLLVSFAALVSIATVFLHIKNKLVLSGVALLLAVFFIGAVFSSLQTRRLQTNHLRDLLAFEQSGLEIPVVLTGVIAEPTVFARGRMNVVLRIESFKRGDGDCFATGLVSIVAESRNISDEMAYRDLRLEFGARVRVATNISWIDKYRNPGGSQLSEYLERNDYEATGFLKSPASISVLDHGPGFNPRGWLNRVRIRVQDRIDEIFSAETSAVLDAVLLGNRFNLSRSTAERFRVGGTFHILVISGLHISLLGGLVLFAVKLLTKSRVWQFCLSNLVVWFYSVAVGAEPSVTRAALMFSFVSFGAVLFRSASSLNALGGAALVLLVGRPTDLFNPSLQLTFLSVLAIVTFAWPLLKNFQAIGRWRPTPSTPYPPSCSLVRKFSELFFWNEREWASELSRSPHSYRLFKCRIPVRLERLRLQWCAGYVFSAIVVSLCVQVCLLPFLVIYFHRLSFAGFALNIIVSLLILVLIPISAFALMVSLISSTATAPMATCANAVNWLLVHSVDLFSNAGIASIRIPEYSGWGHILYVFYFLPLLVIAFALSRWNPLGGPGQLAFNRGIVSLAVLAQTVMLLLVVFHPLSAGRPDGKLHVDFLDVGQGDSALVTMPNGTTLLVDGGGRPSFFQPQRTMSNSEAGFELDRGASVGEAVVSEYLWWRGLSSVDYVLATHADADHIDGLNDVVNNFAVRGALVSRTPSKDPEFAKFSQTLLNNRTPLTVVKSGDTIFIDGVKIEVLWPRASVDMDDPSGNNDSVVLHITFGERRFLMTGDIEKEAERELETEEGRLRADVVKVPHHGSRTSSTDAFVRSCDSALAVISVGQTSMFGHPHPEVVQRWRASRATVMTTGHCGTISVSTDGKNLIVSQFVAESP